MSVCRQCWIKMQDGRKCVVNEMRLCYYKIMFLPFYMNGIVNGNDINPKIR